MNEKLLLKYKEKVSLTYLCMLISEYKCMLNSEYNYFSGNNETNIFPWTIFISDIDNTNSCSSP